MAGWQGERTGERPGRQVRFHAYAQRANRKCNLRRRLPRSLGEALPSLPSQPAATALDQPGQPHLYAKLCCPRQRPVKHPFHVLLAVRSACMGGWAGRSSRPGGIGRLGERLTGAAPCLRSRREGAGARTCSICGPHPRGTHTKPGSWKASRATFDACQRPEACAQEPAALAAPGTGAPHSPASKLSSGRSLGQRMILAYSMQCAGDLQGESGRAGRVAITVQCAGFEGNPRTWAGLWPNRFEECSSWRGPLPH